MEPIEEKVTKDDLERYHRVYKETSVLALRKSFDDFLAGRMNEEMPDYVRAGLDAYRDYLDGKFIVFNIQNGLAERKLALGRSRPEATTHLTF